MNFWLNALPAKQTAGLMYRWLPNTYIFIGCRFFHVAKKRMLFVKNAGLLGMAEVKMPTWLVITERLNISSGTRGIPTSARR